MLRSTPSLQANAAQILVDPRLGVARYTAAARSFDNLGWYLGTSGVGLLYLPDGAGLPERMSFGLEGERRSIGGGTPEDRLGVVDLRALEPGRAGHVGAPERPGPVPADGQVEEGDDRCPERVEVVDRRERSVLGAIVQRSSMTFGSTKRHGSVARSHGPGALGSVPNPPPD